MKFLIKTFNYRDYKTKSSDFLDLPLDVFDMEIIIIWRHN